MLTLVYHRYKGAAPKQFIRKSIFLNSFFSKIFDETTHENRRISYKILRKPQLRKRFQAFRGNICYAVTLLQSHNAI